MLEIPPKHIEEEDHRLAEGWLEVCEEVSAGDYIRANASPEYLKWHNETAAHVKEMRKQGIMV